MSEAFEHFKAAAKLAPDNPKYLKALELARQDLVVEAIRAGNQAMAAGDQLEALLRFREALQLDPDNEFARQALENALPPEAPNPTRKSLAGIVRVQPEPGVRKFHLRGNTRDIISQVTLAYRVTAIFDDSVPNRAVRLDMEDATWREAMSALTLLTKTIWTPLSARQVLFAADTDENRRSFLGMAQRTFYLPQATTPQALNEISTSLRTLFEIRFAAVDAADSSLTVRADARTLDAVAEYLDALRDQLPEVIFQIDVFQISREYTRAIGANIPTEFQVFNIPTELASLASRRLAEPDQPALSGAWGADEFVGDRRASSASSRRAAKLAALTAIRGVRRRHNTFGSDDSRRQLQLLARPVDRAAAAEHDTARLAGNAGGHEDRRAISDSECQLFVHAGGGLVCSHPVARHLDEFSRGVSVFHL